MHGHGQGHGFHGARRSIKCPTKDLMEERGQWFSCSLSENSLNCGSFHQIVQIACWFRER